MDFIKLMDFRLLMSRGGACLRKQGIGRLFESRKGRWRNQVYAQP